MAAREKTNGLRLRVLGDQGTRCERSLCRKHALFRPRTRSDTWGYLRCLLFGGVCPDKETVCNVFWRGKRGLVFHDGLSSRARTACNRQSPPRDLWFKLQVYTAQPTSIAIGWLRAIERGSHQAGEVRVRLTFPGTIPNLSRSNLLLRSWNELDTGFELGHWDGSGAAAQPQAMTQQIEAYNIVEIRKGRLRKGSAS